MSDDATTASAVAFLEERFGVPAHALRGLVFRARDDAFWASTLLHVPDLPAPRMPGLRALRLTPHGMKPTSSFLRCIAPCLSRSVEHLDRARATALLLGRPQTTACTDGYVALAFGDDILGCGRAHDHRLSVLIPTGRRRELLEALGAFAQESPNL